MIKDVVKELIKSYFEKELSIDFDISINEYQKEMTLLHNSFYRNLYCYSSIFFFVFETLSSLFNSFTLKHFLFSHFIQHKVFTHNFHLFIYLAI